MIGEDDPFVNYDQTLETGAGYNFLIRIYASRATEQDGQAILDDLRDNTGSGSIYAALSASWVGESSAYYAHTHAAGPIGVYTIGTIDYIGCEFQVEVIAN